MDKGLMYTYDSVGRRTSYQQIDKLEGEQFRDRFNSTGTRMSYLYDGKSFNVLAEGWDTIGQTTSNRWKGNSDRSFNPTSEYFYTNGKAVVRTDVTSKNHSFINRHSGWQHSKNYYTQDNLGSIIGIMDSNGHVDEKYGYDAFGKLVEGRFDYVNKLGYNGKMYDNYSGLVNYGFRDYSPISMRFTTVDPIRDGTNWYSYVGNDPINMIDPYGLDTIVLGVNITFTDIVNAGMELVNTIQDKIAPDSTDIFTTNPASSFTTSAGAYYDTETNDFGFYGVIGAGKGTPDLTLAGEVSSSPLTVDEFLSGTTTEVGTGVGSGFYGTQVSAILNDNNEIIGSENSIGIGLGLPIDCHADVETTGHISIPGVVGAIIDFFTDDSDDCPKENN